MKSKAKSKKAILIVIAIAVAFFLVLALVLQLTRNLSKSDSQITEEYARERLERLLRNVTVQELTARKAQLDLQEMDLADALPDISKYPLSVQGTAPLNIEIFSSTEKSGPGMDNWLNEVAENFNAQGYEIGGQRVSVSVRSVSSGLAIDYIVSGKYVPEAYSPSNELWGAMIENSNVKIELRTGRIAGNTAGVVIKQQKYNEMIEKYGEINMQSVTEATIAGELALGYTNPYISSTGLNFLITMLQEYDSASPLGSTAVEQFAQFQANIPFVADSTIQMRTAAQNGSLDAFVMEYQSYYNSPEMKGYVYTPLGVRHDSPVYALGTLSAEKSALLNQFIAYCQDSESQKLADEYGFNQKDEYKNTMPAVTGDVLYSAQHLWKEKKDGGRPVAAVFVTDISGSMEGAPLVNLQKSLIGAAANINTNNSIGLVSYNSDVYINLPIAKFDLNQRAYFTGAVQDLAAGGNTATFDAILVALDMLLKEQEANPNAKLMLFVLSDGETNTGTNLKNLKPIIEGLGIPVHTIGYNANIEALKEITDINEGVSINADNEDVVYKMSSMFNSQM